MKKLAKFKTLEIKNQERILAGVAASTKFDDGASRKFDDGPSRKFDDGPSKKFDE